jgi:hypothetical protein
LQQLYKNFHIIFINNVTTKELLQLVEGVVVDCASTPVAAQAQSRNKMAGTNMLKKQVCDKADLELY